MSTNLSESNLLLLVFPAKEAVTKSKKRCHSGARAPAREPGNHEHRPANTLAKLVFIGSEPGPTARPGTTVWYLNHFLTASFAGKTVKIAALGYLIAIDPPPLSRV